MSIRFDLSSIEDYVSNHLRVFILSVAALVLFAGIIAVSVFFIAVRGAEQTMVPDVVGKELTEALLELQVKELYPRLLLRYSQTSSDRGRIMEQEPKPGTIVKAGRRIRLVVSQGVIVNKVENFIGRNINDVKMDLQALYTQTSGLALLSVREPVMYDFSSETPGTILAQKPEPGTDISGPMTLEFVVSKGRENSAVTVPNLTGMGLTEALGVIGNTGINFQFNIRDRNENEKGEAVVSQMPPGNATAPLSAIVDITVTSPEKIADNEIFGLFRYTIPVNPYPLSVRLEALLPSAERIRLFTTDYLGGEFTLPYKLPVGTVLVLSMLNRELYRETVGAQ
ncbi:MAG: PASTA domain-containing protein [Treponema sp.]|jgi:beta-lactam-binding protein with PASTA domain|nr:PASTA domain-containing protein [Treponema sp.]